MPIRVLSRLATTGIYLLHGIPRDLQRAARLRAASPRDHATRSAPASLARVRGGDLDAPTLWEVAKSPLNQRR